MRSDLTTPFTTAMAANGRAPVQLLEIHFASGIVRLSDRDVGPADGLAASYSGLVEDWGTLTDVTAADPGELSAEVRQMSITIWNGADPPFSDHFLREDPENIRADLYQWFYGLADADRALIDRFLIADPIVFDERGRLVRLDLVSLAVNFDQAAGTLLTSDAWPHAKTDDVGRSIDFLFGSCGALPTLCARTAPSATLNGSILATSTTIAVHEDLDDLAFLAAGTLQIGDELIRYGSRTAATFAVIQRGYLSTAAEHLDRDEVVQLVTDHTYLLGRGPLAGITAVKVGGYPAPSGIYTVYPGLDPARIVFNQKPYAYRFSAGSSFLAMQFDTTAGANTAYQAYKAYDAADDATAARIDENHRCLALRQTTVNPDRGAIVKAYLAVEHWESDTITNDYAEVWIEGIGVVGRLSRPNPAEGITVEAEVDIDHGHTHAIGGEHTHTFQDPILQTTEEAHTHTTSTSGIIQPYYYDGGTFGLNAPMKSGERGDSKVVWLTGLPVKWDFAILRFKASLSAGALKVGAYFWAVPGKNAYPLGRKDTADVTTLGLSFTAYGIGVMTTIGSSVVVSDIYLDVTMDSTINETTTGTSTQVAVSGVNQAVSSDKKTTDVNDLVTANVSVDVTAAEASTQSYVNLYDVTRYVNFSWDWFTGRDITVTYRGSADSQSVYVLHCFFDVEYRKKEVFFSDDVTATVSGLIDADGTITGTTGTAVTRADHVLRYLLTACAGYSADDIDAAGTWAVAAARLAALGYTVDGVLAGDSTVKEALKAVCFQNRLRLFYNAGQARLAFSEALADWPEGRAIAAADYQLKSLALERQPARNIVNSVNLYYARDWTSTESGPAGYAKSVAASDTESVARHGVRADDTRFLCDLVRTDAQAASLAAYYAARYGRPSTYLTLNAYLPQFALEKDDKINLTADFHKLRKAKARVVSAARLFGSGKLSQINQIQILAECLRYILIEQSAEDVVAVADALMITVTTDLHLGDAAHAADRLTAVTTAALDEALTIADALAMVAGFNTALDETVTAGEALYHHIGLHLTDTVRAQDDLEGWRMFGYGGGLFGLTGYGGWQVWANRMPDEVGVFDELAVVMTAAPMADTVSASDDLYISSGYGCPIGTGYGLTPYGN